MIPSAIRPCGDLGGWTCGVATKPVADGAGRFEQQNPRRLLSARTVSGICARTCAATAPTIHAPTRRVQFFAVHAIKLRTLRNVVRNVVNGIVVTFAAPKTLAPLETDKNQREKQQQQLPHGIPFPLISKIYYDMAPAAERP